MLPLNLIPELAPTVLMLFTEAFADHPGRQTAVDRLAEYFLVLLLRAAMNERLIKGGVLSGLGDPCLAKAIAAMHDEPERSWSLEPLAHLAGMSRARFAAHFRNVVGVTPFDYLTDWRIGITQTLLRKGEPLKLIAPAVGYTNATALTRIFTQRTRVSPSEWLSRHRSSAQAHDRSLSPHVVLVGLPKPPYVGKSVFVERLSSNDRHSPHDPTISSSGTKL